MSDEVKEYSIHIKIGSQVMWISNHSKTHRLWISVIPNPPKRKYIDIDVIEPGSFIVLDGMSYNMDHISFRWVVVRSDEDGAELPI